MPSVRCPYCFVLSRFVSTYATIQWCVALAVSVVPHNPAFHKLNDNIRETYDNIRKTFKNNEYFAVHVCCTLTRHLIVLMDTDTGYNNSIRESNTQKHTTYKQY